MKRLVMLSVLTLAFSVWGGDAFANEPAGWGGWGHGPSMSPFVLRSLGLSDAQRAQVRQIIANHRSQFQTLRQQLREAREQLAEKILAPGTVQPDDLNATIQRIGELRDQLSREALQVALEIRGVLTPDQLAKAAEVRRRLNELRAEMGQLLRGAR